jgi:hypothetical protein
VVGHFGPPLSMSDHRLRRLYELTREAITGSSQAPYCPGVGGLRSPGLQSPRAADSVVRLPDDARPPSTDLVGSQPTRDGVWWYFAQRSSLSTAAPRSSTTGSSPFESHMRKIRSTKRFPTIIQSTSRRAQWTLT